MDSRSRSDSDTDRLSTPLLLNSIASRGANAKSRSGEGRVGTPGAQTRSITSKWVRMDDREIERLGTPPEHTPYASQWPRGSEMDVDLLGTPGEQTRYASEWLRSLKQEESG